MTEAETQQSSLAASIEHVPAALAPAEHERKNASAGTDLKRGPATGNVDSLPTIEPLNDAHPPELNNSYDTYDIIAHNNDDNYDNYDNNRSRAASESTIRADSPWPSPRTARSTPTIRARSTSNPPATTTAAVAAAASAAAVAVAAAVFFEYTTAQTTIPIQTPSAAAAAATASTGPAEDFHLMQVERKRIVVIQSDGTRIVGEVGERQVGPVSFGENSLKESVEDGSCSYGWESRVRTAAVQVKDEHEGEWEAPVGRYDMLL